MTFKILYPIMKMEIEHLRSNTITIVMNNQDYLLLSNKL